MRFSLFVHMERLTPDQDHKTLYQEFCQLCEIADRGGMVAIWTGEHHAMEFTIAPTRSSTSRIWHGAPRTFGWARRP
jgi:alkanesulfonate monooxygenase SsuD/methylene tetrahydromethanopterin reductase-like flavin-dependent oxidoreductase (luciferase family)